MYSVGPIIAKCTKALLPLRRKSKPQLSHGTASLGTHLSTVTRSPPSSLGLLKRELDFSETPSLTISALSRTMADAVGLAASVIAIIDLSAKVAVLCLQYSRPGTKTWQLGDDASLPYNFAVTIMFHKVDSQPYQLHHVIKASIQHKSMILILGIYPLAQFNISKTLKCVALHGRRSGDLHAAS
ncbi:hypothetical protein EDB80DRAFT_306350 [Ilyonectria destructans]|nr:hypothetical protein EDB80DRAFT_306350 [Ilyonectria destructans]